MPLIIYAMISRFLPLGRHAPLLAGAIYAPLFDITRKFSAMPFYYNGHRPLHFLPLARISRRQLRWRGSPPACLGLIRIYAAATSEDKILPLFATQDAFARLTEHRRIKAKAFAAFITISLYDSPDGFDILAAALSMQ